MVDSYNAFDMEMEVNLYTDAFFPGLSLFQQFLDFVPGFVKLSLRSQRCHFYFGGPF